MELFAAPELRYHPVAFPSISSSPPTPAAFSPAPANSSPPVEDVVAALEHATTSAKRLSSAAAADSSEGASAIASLRNAHRIIGSFLAQFEPWRPPPGDGAAAAAAADYDEEPMSEDWAVAVEEAGEADASSDAGEAEEGMGECALQSKRRRKRPVPPCWPAGRAGDREMAAADPVDRRRLAMDLVFQFRG